MWWWCVCVFDLGDDGRRDGSQAAGVHGAGHLFFLVSWRGRGAGDGIRLSFRFRVVLAAPYTVAPSPFRGSLSVTTTVVLRPPRFEALGAWCRYAFAVWDDCAPATQEKKTQNKGKGVRGRAQGAGDRQQKKMYTPCTYAPEKKNETEGRHARSRAPRRFQDARTDQEGGEGHSRNTKHNNNRQATF